MGAPFWSWRLMASGVWVVSDGRELNQWLEYLSEEELQLQTVVIHNSFHFGK